MAERRGRVRRDGLPKQLESESELGERQRREFHEARLSGRPSIST